MSKFVLTILCLYVILSHAQIQEQIIKSDISEVTVFIKDAQITRKKTVDIKPGKSILKFIDLSPYIVPKSIQLKTQGALTVLAVNHQQNFIDKLEKQKELKELEDALEKLETELQLEHIYLDILTEELAFLTENRNIGGANQVTKLTTLKETAHFYSNRLTALKLKEVKHKRNIRDLNDQKTDLTNQINTLGTAKKYPKGEILVKINAKSNTEAPLELSYVVKNASWHPSYDIRATNVNKPIDLGYKANIIQDTKVDWNNVQLNLSSANPNISGVAPKLKTYFLNYNTRAPRYGAKQNLVTGTVLDESGEPLLGVNIIVKGTTIGTNTDFDGNYSLTVPNQQSHLVFSYVGFNDYETLVSNLPKTLLLSEDASALEEVVVTGYGTGNGKSFVFNETKRPKKEIASIPLERVINQTSVHFEIKTPYTIKSDNKSYTVDMVHHELEADYHYYAVPKIEPDVYLMANITSWEKFNLLEGEANIFFEDTYVGKSLLDLHAATDTLQLSLGPDKNIVIKREKISALTSKKFIGSKKEELRYWKINIKNNKRQAVKLLLSDQIPLSANNEIKVELHKKSGAKHNEQTGELKWECDLAPNNTKELDIKYSVTYPKYRNLNIE